MVRTFRRLGRHFVAWEEHLLALHSDLRHRPARAGRRLQQSVVMWFNLRLRRLRWLWKHGQTTPDDIRRPQAAAEAHAGFGNSRTVRRQLW
jgi:hypothetical protein